MTKPHIVSLGEVLWDLFPDGEKFGGAPANFACHAAIQGASVSMVSAVGDDERGRSATQILSNYGIDVDLLQTVTTSPTGTVGINLDKNGKPAFTIHDDSAWDHLTWNPGLASRLKSADAVYFGTLGQRQPKSRNTIQRALATATERRIVRILDVNLRSPFFDDELIRESIRLASILKLSDDELAIVSDACGTSRNQRAEETLGDLLSNWDLDLIVMTQGAKGALLVGPDGPLKQNSIPTTVVDTVGAGDSFAASFLVGELRGESRDKNLKRACENAALTCGHSGAVPEI